MKINRFPKMTALQKFRALKLGYPEEEAEAIGIAEATKYAIFKNAVWSKSYQEKEEKSFEELIGEASRKKTVLPGLDWGKYKPFKIASKDGKPFVGGKVFTSSDYKRQIFFKRGDEVGKKIEEWAKNIIEQTPPEILENEQKFFNEVWKKHRDEQFLEDNNS